MDDGPDSDFETNFMGDALPFATDPRKCSHQNSAPLTEDEDECYDCGEVVTGSDRWSCRTVCER
ncbi:Uncharacterised protein [Mycobacteroides abscessus subsp. abscessus]|jgi:hypothetical protein|nr:Uncharacterised protein [Mycobacteroides abscessus subsp. abscessus]